MNNATNLNGADQMVNIVQRNIDALLQRRIREDKNKTTEEKLQIVLRVSPVVCFLCTCTW